MEPWERIERKIDRLTWWFLAYVLLQVGMHFVSLSRTLFWGVVAIAIVDLVLLTPFMRTLFPGLGRHVLAFNRWVLRKVVRGAQS